MFPYLNFFLTEAYKIPIIEEVQIFTNANVDLKKIKTDKKLSFLLAYHPTEIKNEELFINNIKYCLNNNFNCIVSVLLIQSKKYIDQINNFIKKIKPLNCTIEHKHIFTNSKGKVNFKFDVTGEDEEKRYKLNDKLLSVKDIKLNNLNRFNGWKCELHHIDVEVDGSIQIGCMHSDYNIFKDIDFFEKLNDDVLTVTCNEDKCENYCWFDFFKYSV
jgi:hypothetical protein